MNDPRLIARAINRTYNITRRVATYFLLNGRSFPYTFRESLVVVKPDEKVKLRVLNGGLSLISLHPHGQAVTETDLDGIPVVVTRTGWTSEVGYEIYLRDGSRGTELWERIMEAGRPHDIRPTGPSDIRRIEGGIFNHGIDMTITNNPYEMGLERLVDLDIEPDFMGKEALRRIKAEGVARRIVGVEIAGDPINFNTELWPVGAEGARKRHAASFCLLALTWSALSFAAYCSLKTSSFFSPTPGRPSRPAARVFSFWVLPVLK